MKFIYDAVGSSRHGAGVAPAEARAIIGNDAIGFRQFFLQSGPAQNGGHQAGFEDESEWPGAFLQNVQVIGSEVHHSAKRRIGPRVFARPPGLVQDPERNADNKDDRNPNQNRNQSFSSVDEVTCIWMFSSWNRLRTFSATCEAI